MKVVLLCVCVCVCVCVCPQELAGISDDLSLPPEESSTPEQCLSKLIALIKSAAFSLVLATVFDVFPPILL